MRKFSKRSMAITAASVAVVAVGAGGAAYAAGWFQGAGTATVTTASIGSVTATTTLVGNLFPGKTINSSTTVTNPNPYAVSVTGITGENLISTTGDTGCTLANSKITAAIPPGMLPVPANGSTTISVPISMGIDADSTCAASTLKFGFTLTGNVA
jgi:hypothetical protein